MCGIAGVAGEVSQQDRDYVVSMCKALRHRGPDELGFHNADGIAMGIARLSIVDVANGQQPVCTPDGSVHAVMNGEIYNHRELRRGMVQPPASGSDAAVLPGMYRQRGDGFIETLRGMFAIALWDSNEHRLVLVRDRLGKKPLYLFPDSKRLWFASELKALLLLPHIRREVDPVALAAYLSLGYVPGSQSAVRGTHKLAPGHLGVYRDGSFEETPYWRLSFQSQSSGPVTKRSVAALGEQLRDQILDATRIRLESERPMGAFLSGGLDSSAVVAAMARNTGQVSTFSVGFKSAEFNELRYAARVASLYGTNHQEYVLDPSASDLVTAATEVFDEPFADSSAMPSLLVAKEASKSVVVALNGDGGDEAFGGYPRYRNFMKAYPNRRLPRGFVKALRAVSTRVDTSHLSTNARTGFRKYARIAASSPSERYERTMAYFFPEELARLVRSSTPLARDIATDMYGALWDGKLAHVPQPAKMMATDYVYYLPGDLLPKVDMTTMSASLEARSPLLDHKLVEWSAGIPSALHFYGGTTKGLFKSALEPWLPSDLIHRKKQGFSVPLEEWVQGPLRALIADTLLVRQPRYAEYLNRVEVSRMVSHGLRNGGAASRIWSLFVLEVWLQRLHGSSSV
jgi:asparagine synthase (glutamine-hydrolysing)